MGSGPVVGRRHGNSLQLPIHLLRQKRKHLSKAEHDDGVLIAKGETLPKHPEITNALSRPEEQGKALRA